MSAYWLDETDGDGEGGFATSFGPSAAFTNLWVGSWIEAFSQPVAELGETTPLVLARGAWAGAARNGIVLWSSDIASTFEQLAHGPAGRPRFDERHPLVDDRCRRLWVW